MLDFGKHSIYIFYSYGLSGLCILGLIAYSYLRGRK